VVLRRLEPAVDACRHSGSTDRGEHSFAKMRENIGDRSDEHVACDAANWVEVDEHLGGGALRVQEEMGCSLHSRIRL
jgi:hypothetical protein